MVELTYPGVYIVEVPPVARAITAAPTSNAAFIGMAEKGPAGKAIAVTSFTEFMDIFGTFTTKKAMKLTDVQGDPNVYLPYAVWAFFQNGGRKCYIIRVAPGAEAATFDVPGDGGTAFTIKARSPGTDANKLSVAVTKATMYTDDKPIYKIEVKTDDGRDVLELFDGLTTEEGADNSLDTMVNDNSRYIDILNLTPNSRPELDPPDEGDAGAGAGGAAGGAGVSLMFAPPKPGYKLDEQKPGTAGRDALDSDILTHLEVGTSALDEITDVSLIAAPGYTSYEVINTGFAYAERHRNSLGDAFFIADVPVTKVDQNQVKDFVRDSKFNPGNNGYGALYFPWIEARDRVARGRNPKIPLPPSGFVAGVYARIDNVRGVWKAPAGTEATISGGLELKVKLTDLQQGIINLAGVNALRHFEGYGTVVWGARTVSSSNIAWRYVPVRRMANFLKSSIYDGIKWAVFEPNDAPLWDALRLSIGGFMLDLFRQHAFQGSTPEEAFFVKCDRETTSETDQQNGIVNVLVGFAPLKPAEFVVVKLSQKVSQQQT